MNYQPGDILGGKYKILSVIGGGSMGTVYRAEHMSIRKPVAIKVMQGDYAALEEYRERFMREARSAASLEHFNICTVMDFDMTEQGDAYIVMELLSGESLKDRIVRLGVLEPLSACLIMRQLMSALGCAHAKGIVHRDIKPDNVILISHEGRDDFVKLIDFGVAHIEHPETADMKPLTQIGQVYGTPQYLAPEQAQGEAIDYRADLYSAGTIFYEMLVGVPPFQSGNYLELLMRQVEEPPPHLPETLPQWERLDAIIQRLLKKNPNDRYNTASDVIMPLDESIMLLAVDNPGISTSHLASYSGSLAMNIQKMTLSATSNAAVEPISAEMASVLPKTRKQKWIFAVIVVLSALALVVVFQLVLGIYNQTRLLAEAAPEEPDHVQLAIDRLSQEGKIVRIEDEIRKPEPYNLTEKEFRVGSDLVLATDPELVSASEAYLSKDYDEAFRRLNNVKEKYWEHPNFLRLYLICCRKLKGLGKTEKIRQGYASLGVEALVQLLSVEPLAGRNPAVLEIGRTLFGESERPDGGQGIQSVLLQHPGCHTCTALSWLIVKMPYEPSSAASLGNMIESYDALKSAPPVEGGCEVPVWLSQAVEIRRIERNDCVPMKAALETLAGLEEGRQDIIEHVLIPIQKWIPKKRTCTKKDGEDCAVCNEMRTWLEGVVAESGG